MRKVGAFEAKTHFSQLLLEVAHGKKILITKHGQNVAILAPPGKEYQESITSPAKQAINTIKSLRKGIVLGKGLTVKQLKEEGRK